MGVDLRDGLGKGIFLLRGKLIGVLDLIGRHLKLGIYGNECAHDGPLHASFPPAIYCLYIISPLHNRCGLPSSRGRARLLGRSRLGILGIGHSLDSSQEPTKSTKTTASKLSFYLQDLISNHDSSTKPQALVPPGNCRQRP